MLTLTDPKTGLQCRCEVTVFDDFPAIEWVLYFKNNGDKPTPIIEDILPLDTTFSLAKDRPAIVHHANGSDCRMDDFAPLETQLGQNSQLHLCPNCARSSSGTLPFFNIEMGSEGVIGAIGWSGSWRADITRREDDVQLSAGMKKTHLKLLPGEEIRTPRILLLFWENDRIQGHNMLRRFILAHHTPYYDGEVLQAPVCELEWGENPDYSQIQKARWCRDNDIPTEYIWIDAGWFGDSPYNENATTFDPGWWSQVGNWWPNKITYPNGLKPVGDALKEMGLGFVLWIEAERAFNGTKFVCEHPEWFIGPKEDSYLLNLGLPEARKAITDLVSDILIEGGVTCYRQDFNFDPASYWEEADTPDRVGMSEIRHIEGLYAFWDELRSRIPGLIIDNCAGGGRRIDLETISRSIPLWRSDFQCWPDFDPIGMQGQTSGLSLWVPLSTGCYSRADEPDTYAFRSALGPGLVTTLNMYGVEPTCKLPFDWLRKAMAEEFRVRKYFYGDFYPLLSFTLADDAWVAWQFDRSDLGEGMVLAIRRPNSPFITMVTLLRGLDPDAVYEFASQDGGDSIKAMGNDLMNMGFRIDIDEKPGSVLYIYKKLR